MCVLVVNVESLLCSAVIHGLRLRATQWNGFQSHSGQPHPSPLEVGEEHRGGRGCGKLMAKPGSGTHHFRSPSATKHLVKWLHFT